MQKKRVRLTDFCGVLLSGLLILAFASPAMGQFEKNHLIQVVYNENDNEVGVDLGDLSAMNFSEEDVLLGQAGSVTLDRFPTISDWSDLNMGYFAYDDGTYENWFATTQSSAPTVSTGGFSTFQNQAMQVQTHYDSNQAAPGVAVASAGALQSYDQLMNDGSAAPGNYGGFNTDWQDGESPLGLLSSQGYVDMYLYHYEVITLNRGPDPNTDYTAVLRIMADGTTILNPSSGQNQPPVANDDAASTREDTPVDINVIANDTDGDGTIYETTVSIVLDAQYGTTFDNGDGTVTYTPDPGFTGSDAFTYTVEDNEGALSNEAAVTVEVTAGNESPVANDDAATTSQDTPVDVNVVANDTDGDGMINEVTVSIIMDASNGTTFENGDGTVTYMPAPGFLGSDAFTYTVEDDEGAVSNEATVTVEVTAGNQPPVANDDAATTTQDIPVDVNVVANDTDADGTIDETTVSIVMDGQYGTTFDNGDGMVTYTPGPGFAGSDAFTYTVQDNEGAVSNEATVTVLVAGSGGVLCSFLGDDPRPYAPDMDVFGFSGTEGEIVTVRLESDPFEYGAGQRAVLIMRSLGRGLRLFKRLQDTLPLEMTVTLPVSGDYHVKVMEAGGREVIWGENYEGDYCVILEGSPEIIDTFGPAYSVE